MIAVLIRNDGSLRLRFLFMTVVMLILIDLVAVWTRVWAVQLLGNTSFGTHRLYCQKDVADCGLAVINNACSML